MGIVSECRSLNDPTPMPPAFARTYGGRQDSWEKALLYDRVMEYCGDHQDSGSTAVATALEVNRNRIRVWVDDGGAPDVVHGLRAALDREWFVPVHQTRRRRALAECVTWTFAGGSIETNRFVPRFVARDPAEQNRITEAALDLGIQLSWIDRDDDGKGVEAQPTEDRSVFGRVLFAAGGSTDPADVLPAWILEGPEDLRRACAAVYVECRGQRTGKANVLQIQEQAASRERLESIGELLAGAVDSDGWTVSQQHVRLTAATTRALLEEVEIDL